MMVVGEINSHEYIVELLFILNDDINFCLFIENNNNFPFVPFFFNLFYLPFFIF
jgi:hypothetical protein